jgi:hypothetical protein
MSLKQYVDILDRYKIAYTSITLSYDTKSNSKRAIHPTGWRTITFDKRIFNPKMNAIMQITGATSGIVVIDIDGELNNINQELIQLCSVVCKFYNKTRKGYHFFFLYTDSLPTAFRIKKYLISKIWQLNIENINLDVVKSYYPRTQKLLNYKFFTTYINKPTTSFKNIILGRKIAFIQGLLSKFGAQQTHAFNFSIECGISKEGRKRNSKVRKTHLL